MPDEKKMIGTVKFWDVNRGLGFVIPDLVARIYFATSGVFGNT